MRLHVLIAPALLFFVSAKANARETVAVSWGAPLECPSSDELARRTASRVPSDSTFVRAKGQVQRFGTKYRLVLEVQTVSTRGERVLEADSCDALATLAAIVIALSVATPTSTPLAPAPVPAPVPPPVSPSAPASAREYPSALTIRTDFVLDSGTLPTFGAGAGAAIGLTFRKRYHIEAYGSAFASQDGTVANDPSRGATFLLISGGARACGALTTGIEAGPCFGFAVMRLSASGFGASKNSNDSSTTWGPEGGIRIRAPLVGRFGLVAGAFAVVPTVRPSFVMTARGLVHEASPVAFRGFLGPEVFF